MGEVAPLGDGEGRKNIKFHYFFGQSRTPVPTIKGVCAHNRRARFENSVKLSRMKVFAELFSKSDPKTVRTLCSQSASENVRQKSSCWKFFAPLFFKKVAKNINT